MAAAAQQRGFCRAMSSSRWRWRVGGAVALSRHWCRRAGVGGKEPDNQLEEREEGEGERGEGDTQHGERHVKRAVAFWGDVEVHRAALLGAWAAM